MKGFKFHPVIGIEEQDEYHVVKLPLGNNLYFKCKSCGLLFPAEYQVKNPSAKVLNSGKSYGTRQLMRIFAWSNFKKHLNKCRG